MYGGGVFQGVRVGKIENGCLSCANGHPKMSRIATPNTGATIPAKQEFYAFTYLLPGSSNSQNCHAERAKH